MEVWDVWRHATGAYTRLARPCHGGITHVPGGHDLTMHPWLCLPLSLVPCSAGAVLPGHVAIAVQELPTPLTALSMGPVALKVGPRVCDASCNLSI